METKLPETLQDYFNIAWEHAIVKQSSPSFIIDSNGSYICVYRNSSGNRCLIGAAIPDDRYISGIEGKASTDVLPMLGLVSPMYIDQLQNCHDDVARQPKTQYLVKVKKKLIVFAYRYFLTIPGMSLFERTEAAREILDEIQQEQ